MNATTTTSTMSFNTTASARTARHTITDSTSAGPTTTTKSLWRTGVVAGLGAAAATTAVAAVARAIDVPIETAPGEAIPILGFAQLTMFFTVVGLVIATVLRRQARHPRST